MLILISISVEFGQQGETFLSVFRFLFLSLSVFLKKVKKKNKKERNKKKITRRDGKYIRIDEVRAASLQETKLFSLFLSDLQEYRHTRKDDSVKDERREKERKKVPRRRFFPRSDFPRRASRSRSVRRRHFQRDRRLSSPSPLLHSPLSFSLAFHFLSLPRRSFLFYNPSSLAAKNVVSLPQPTHTNIHTSVHAHTHIHIRARLCIHRHARVKHTHA